MAHLQYLPGDPRLVDQLVCELKSKGIFDQFRKECIADVDTRPAYQNLRQRVESSVASFLSRQCWKPDLNKNQLREKLRKHLLDGNYLEQGVERIVDQVVNPKVASVFIPQVEDLVYNYLGIPRKKSNTAETSNGKIATENDLLPTDLEAVSPGSVKSNDDNKSEAMDTSESQGETKMEIDEDKPKADIKEDSVIIIESEEKDKTEGQDSRLSGISELTSHESDISIDKSTIPLPAEEIKLENIPAPDNSPPNIKNKNIDLEKIDLPKEPNLSTDIPLPDEMPKLEKDSSYFKAINMASEDDDDSSSDSSLRRNMSPLTPIRNFNNENSCDAQQAFEVDSDNKSNDKKEPSSFRFTIESKSSENSSDAIKSEKKDGEQVLSYQFNNQVNINTFNTPLYEDSSNSNNLQIDYESDANSKATTDTKLPEADQNSGDSKKDRKTEEKKSSHKSSHRSRDSHRHSNSKDKRSDSKHSTSRDSSRHDKKPSKDDHKSKSGHKERSAERSDKKDSRDSSKHRSSHKSSSHKDSKHRSSSSSKHSSSTKHDDKKSTSSHRDKEKCSDKSKDKSKDSKSSSHRSDKDKDRKSSSTSKSKSDEKENKEKKEKKETDDHYSLSGRGNPNRRSTDRDSNDGSSSSKGSQHPSSSKSTESKKDNKGSSKSDNTSASGDSTSPSDKDVIVNEAKSTSQSKPIRVDTHLKVPIASPPRLPFVPDVTLKKPRFAANLEEAKRMMKMRKFLEEEQKRMNQEAALLLEFQANVRPSLSQVYSSIPGPELEFACISNSVQPTHTQVIVLDETPITNGETQEIDNTNVVTNTVNGELDDTRNPEVNIDEPKDSIAETLIAMHLEHNQEQGNVDTGIATQEEIDESNSAIIATLSNNDEENQIRKSNVEVLNSNTGNEYVTQGIIIQTQTDGDEASKKSTEYFEVTIITEELSENEDSNQADNKMDEFGCFEESLLRYFGENEKYNAEIERDRFSKFYKSYTERVLSNKMYLINCGTYEENVIKEVSENFGSFEIINYHKNGHLKLPKPVKNIVKDVNLTTEVTLPTKVAEEYDNCVNSSSPVFSPVKSECSFELSSDYDAKLEEMVNKTSRREIMEIILGGIMDESPSKMPKIGYCMESSIESSTGNNLKRRLEECSVESDTENCLNEMNEVESTMNNNRHILTPKKMRRLSESDQISSTTEETEDTLNNKVQNNGRSKYLGKARRVGLPRPKRAPLPNSPNSDKSVENYETNSPEPTPNGKLKVVRNKVQRYDTSDLYKPKLHYLSRRNNIS